MYVIVTLRQKNTKSLISENGNKTRNASKTENTFAKVGFYKRI